MKLTKRVLSGLLAFVMVLALCPVIPFAEEATPTVEAVNVGTMDKDPQRR